MVGVLFNIIANLVNLLLLILQTHMHHYTVYVYTVIKCRVSHSIELLGVEYKRLDCSIIYDVSKEWFDLSRGGRQVYEKRTHSPLRSGPGVGETQLEWQREWSRQQLAVMRDDIVQHCRQTQQQHTLREVVMEDQVPDIGWARMSKPQNP